MWLDWMTATATSMNMRNCVACSSARPTLFTTPAPMFPSTDPAGFYCMIALTMQADPPNCTTLNAIFPPVKNSTLSPVFIPKADNYTCFTRSSHIILGDKPVVWCKDTINVNGWQNASTMIWGRADLFWYCGDRTLHVSLPPDWSGTCAMVRLGLPLFLLGERQQGINPHVRKRRDLFAITSSSTTYIDAIGVPRGVPDEYKLVDQGAAGFENLPIIGALFPITQNKNIDRINYIHYNVLRLANKTRDAVAGLSEQLAATSLMTVQNRMALDMLLAEKGGVCFMFGDQCCMFIPNNTAPDGSVTRALEGLKTLSEEMHEHSGIDNSLGGIFNSWFGKWKGLVVSVFLFLAGMMTALMWCGCCCIPCIRSLYNRVIITAIEGKAPPPYQMAQMETETMALAGREDYASESECDG
ncbi:syncytin-B-like [Chiloscyllium plagiosum]|uniref:syncytin-B-like n=1 Tax=Chiloscyllium plagiosum TaxID=36176 RepID=UPI001CB801D8|nr:syncytin-B-like [Chiloscyllium plagiosum]XP_043534391.1 syncytin-B-like [Chiloscyllium plagiosum]XP_043534392.1 syncytin-B-like [Chiloscyllium plagiosum]XP_043534393.1 syncytin-B-like [Chiloscyllium plagiosum]